MHWLFLLKNTLRNNNIIKTLIVMFIFLRVINLSTLVTCAYFLLLIKYFLEVCLKHNRIINKLQEYNYKIHLKFCNSIPRSSTIFHSIAFYPTRRYQI